MIVDYREVGARIAETEAMRCRTAWEMLRAWPPKYPRFEPRMIDLLQCDESYCNEVAETIRRIDN